MGFNQSLDPWKLTAQNNTRDMKINRRENFWLLFHFPVWQVIRQLIEVSFQLYYKWKSKITGLLSTQDPWNSETASSLKKYFFLNNYCFNLCGFCVRNKNHNIEKKSLKASLKTSSANLLIKKRRRCESQSDTLFFSLLGNLETRTYILKNKNDTIANTEISRANDAQHFWRAAFLWTCTSNLVPQRWAAFESSVNGKSIISLHQH